MWIGAVFALFPDAQFVNVVRDPRGAVASQIPMGWDEPDVALAGSLANWEASIERVDAFASQLRPDQLLDVRYEDLVRGPSASSSGSARSPGWPRATPWPRRWPLPARAAARRPRR